MALLGPDNSTIKEGSTPSISTLVSIITTGGARETGTHLTYYLLSWLLYFLYL